MPDTTYDATRDLTRPQASGMALQDGPLSYHLYTPTAPVADAPLIVMLHGCSQSPVDFAKGTRMNEAADAIGAHVIWPEQSRSANPNLCWNWFEPTHQARTGEAAAIAQLATTIRASHTPAARGIHVAGLSAGGAMAAILGAQYDDVFTSIGVHSGLPAGSARDFGSAFMAMNSGGTATLPVKVPSIVFHGTDDRTVDVSNAQAIVPAQGTPTTRTSNINGRTASITGTKAPLSEVWEIEGLGHAWSGGDDAGGFADPLGPNATAEMIRFFKAVHKA